MSTQCAVCITAKGALVETPKETNMLKYCNLSHRVLFFKGLVIRGFVFMQQMLLIHIKVLQRDWGTYTGCLLRRWGWGRSVSSVKRPITEEHWEPLQALYHGSAFDHMHKEDTCRTCRVLGLIQSISLIIRTDKYEINANHEDKNIWDLV